MLSRWLYIILGRNCKEETVTPSVGDIIFTVIREREAMANALVYAVEASHMTEDQPVVAQIIERYRRTFLPYNGSVLKMAGWPDLAPKIEKPTPNPDGEFVMVRNGDAVTFWRGVNEPWSAQGAD